MQPLVFTDQLVSGHDLGEDAFVESTYDSREVKSFELKEEAQHAEAVTADSVARDLQDSAGVLTLPTPFTPSIRRTLDRGSNTNNPPPELPSGLTVSVLKSRLEGKKVK